MLAIAFAAVIVVMSWRSSRDKRFLNAIRNAAALAYAVFIASAESAFVAWIDPARCEVTSFLCSFAGMLLFSPCPFGRILKS
jgi:hypothetical protein